MSLPTLFELCVPREDVQRGSIAEADFAADLAQVLRGEAPADYRDPARFFANTHPTHGLKTLLRAVGERLTASSRQIAPIFRLDTQYGGGKTHALIALVHTAREMPGVANIAEFLPPELVPSGPVRIAAFDGENADPFNGRAMGEGVRASIRRGAKSLMPWPVDPTTSESSAVTSIRTCCRSLARTSG